LRLLNDLVGCDATDTEVGGSKRQFVVLGAFHQDVRWLQVSMHNRWTQPMCKGNNLGKLADQLGSLFMRKPALRLVPFLNQASKVATLDILVLQTGRVCTQVGVPQFNNARMFALPHDPVQDAGFVAERLGSSCIQAEFQDHGRHVRQKGVACFPDLPETPDAQEFDQLKINALHWSLAGLEAWQSAWQEGN